MEVELVKGGAEPFPFVVAMLASVSWIVTGRSLGEQNRSWTVIVDAAAVAVTLRDDERTRLRRERSPAEGYFSC